MASPSTSPNHSFVFKLKHKSATGKEESRRYGFSGDLRHPAVFTGLYDRTAQVFNLPRSEFELATTDNLGRQNRLQGYDSFIEHVCEPTLSPENQRTLKLDDKKRIVLVFHVVKHTLPEPEKVDQSVTLSAPHTTLGNDQAAVQEDLEASNWDKETAEALARSQETFNAEQEAREKGRKAYEEVKAAEEARRLAAATAMDSTPLVDVSSPVEAVKQQATSLAGPPAPPAVPLSAFRPYHPYHSHSHPHHHHHSQQGTSGPAALGGPFHHHHLPPHAHAHAHSHSHSHSAHGQHSESNTTHDGLTSSRLAVMEKRIELRRQMQERLQAQSRPSPADATVVIPAEVSARDGYHPAYSTASNEIAQEQTTAPDSPMAETWSGVKGMLKTFVRDLNRHLADNFGDDTHGFELSLPGEGEEKVEEPKVEVKKDVKVEEPEEKVVHRTCFCDRCLKTIVGVRHKCTGCSNYDLCTPCLEGRESFHNAQHIFARIARPGAMPVVDTAPVQKEEESAPAPVEEQPVPLEIHAATCDACDKTIKGARHKCLECPDFDLCAPCLDSVASVIHPLHNFVPIASPRVLRIRAQPGSHAIHSNIICDTCDASPIVGVRYRCVEPECGDQFDMCERCEAEPIPRHPRSHRLLKIREPVVGGERTTRERMERAREIGGPVGGQQGDAVPIAGLGSGIERILKSLGVGAPITAEKGTSTEEQQQGLPSWATIVKGPGNDKTIFIDVDVNGTAVEEKTTIGENVQLGQAPYDVDTLVREAEQEEVEEKEQEEQQPEPEEETEVEDQDQDERAVQTAVEEDEVAPVPVDDSFRASFVADVTLNDGSIVPSGAEVNKVWLVVNSGTCAWPQGTALVNVGGFSNFVAGEAGVKQFEVAAAEPGEAVEIQCELKAAEDDGHYMDYWRLQAPNGELFGDRFWVDIIVESVLRDSDSSLNSSFVAPSMHASGKLQGPSTVATGTEAAPTVSSVAAPSVKSESIEGTSEFESVRADPEDEGSSEEEMSEEDTNSEEESEEDEEFVVLTGSENGESSSEDEDWRA